MGFRVQGVDSKVLYRGVSFKILEHGTHWLWDLVFSARMHKGFRIYCSERVLENFVFLVFKGLGLVDCTHP